MPSKQQSRRPALLARLFSAVRETSAPAPDSFGGLKNIFQGLVLISDRWPPHSASRWTHPGQDGATAPKIGPCPCPGAQHSWLPKFEVFRLDRRFCSRAKDICDAAELKTHLQHPLHLCRAFQLRLEAVGHLVEEVTLAAVGSGGVQGAGARGRRRRGVSAWRSCADGRGSEIPPPTGACAAWHAEARAPSASCATRFATRAVVWHARRHTGEEGGALGAHAAACGAPPARANQRLRAAHTTPHDTQWC